MTTSSDLFARKFDAETDAEILDILEAHLRTQGTANERGPVLAADPFPMKAARQTLARNAGLHHW